jgi:hypothetical protein
VYWASGSQFRRLHEQLHPTVHHACGPGKTAELLRGAGIENLAVFPSAAQWRRWMNAPTTSEPE